MTQTVYLATNRCSSVKKYHTQEDCRALQQAGDYRAVDRAALFDDQPKCAFCAGEWDGGRKPTRPDKISGRCRSCGAKKDASGTCPFCAACDDVGVTNGRHKWHRAARRGAGGD